MQPSSCRIQPDHDDVAFADDEVVETCARAQVEAPQFEFTPDQVEAPQFEFTPDQVEALDDTASTANYEPGQESEFGGALLRAGVPCTISRDDSGQVVYTFECAAPRASGPKVRIDSSLRAMRRVRVPAGRVPRARAREPRPAGSRRTSSSSRTSSTDPGDDPDPEPEPPAGGFEFVLVDGAPASRASGRPCRCDRARPYTRPNWDVGPDGGHCRSCGRDLREHDVRRMHAIALEERARMELKGWTL